MIHAKLLPSEDVIVPSVFSALVTLLSSIGAVVLPGRGTVILNFCLTALFEYAHSPFFYSNEITE